MLEIKTQAVIPFLYEGQRQVRATRGPDGAAWFVISDLCDVLEIKNSRAVAAKLDDDEVATGVVQTAGLGERKVTIVSEAGMYEVVMRSNRTEARKFRRWLTHEVLPAIAHDGIYVTDEKRAELANTTAMISGSIASALDVLRKTPGAERVVAQLEQVRQQHVLGELVGICGGAEAYKALL